MSKPIAKTTFTDCVGNEFTVSRDVIHTVDGEGVKLPLRIGKDQLMSIVSSPTSYVALEYSWGFIYLYPDGTYEISIDSN
jgi:hypothetical protein